MYVIYRMKTLLNLTPQKKKMYQIHFQVNSLHNFTFFKKVSSDLNNIIKPQQNKETKLKEKLVAYCILIKNVVPFCFCSHLHNFQYDLGTN